MVELDHHTSAVNTSVNKMRLDMFVLFNYCRFASYSEFVFQCLNSFNVLNQFCASEMN